MKMDEKGHLINCQVFGELFSTEPLPPHALGVVKHEIFHPGIWLYTLYVRDNPFFSPLLKKENLIRGKHKSPRKSGRKFTISAYNTSVRGMAGLKMAVQV